MDIFSEWMDKVFTISNQKVTFVCGDMNVDLLNSNEHKLTDDFTNTIYSLGLYPKITRPS